MPVYEEKLVCPLSIRFTQEHIKTHFKDGRVVEETVDEIVSLAGVGDYDVVLDAPFPDIEIIRWSGDHASEERHWFTLDNRRLYTLQRAAVELWPQRVAAKVRILYADAGHVRRKYDSTTFGSSVTVSPSCKVAALFRWDWRLEVPGRGPAEDAPAAWAALAADDKKDTVDELLNVGGEGSGVLERALSALERGSSSSSESDELEKAADVAKGSRTASTRAESDGCSSPSSASSRPGSARRGSEAEGLAEKAIQEIKRQLRVPGNDGRLRIPRWGERYAEQLGSLRQFVEAYPKEFTVCRERGGQFTVTLAGAAQTPAVAARAAQPQPVAAAVAAARAWGAAAASMQQQIRYARAAELAAMEVQGILASQGGTAPAWIQEWWKNRHALTLGPLRDFLESRPDLFLVVPTTGKGFRVASMGCMMAMSMGY